MAARPVRLSLLSAWCWIRMASGDVSRGMAVRIIDPSADRHAACRGFAYFPNRIAGCARKAGRVQADFGELFSAGGVGDETVGHAQASDVGGGDVVGDGVFENGAAEAVLQGVIFNREDRPGGAEDALEHLAVERFAEARVDHADGETFGFQILRGLKGILNKRAISEEYCVRTFLEHARFAELPIS